MTITKSFSVQQFFVGAFVAILTSFGIAGMAYADSGTGVTIDIGSNGGALVRGAKVTAISSTTVNANTSYGSSVLSWIVKTDGDTEFASNKNGGSGLANIAVGDTISFRGTIDQAVSGLTVKAKVVKDWTHAETRAKLEGIVTSINTTLYSFTVKKGDAMTTVQTSSSTKFKEDGDGATFADLFVNAKVKIAGMFNASSSILNATSVDIDEDNDSDDWDKDDKKEWRSWIRSKVWLRWGN